VTKIVVLTGAGISAESGIRTFRGSDGLWEGHRIEEVATPEGFDANPNLVLEFYNQRRRTILSSDVKPNLAHVVLANWEASLSSGQLLLITQNVDDLHVRAGSKNVLPMHGELLKARCLDTGEIFPWVDDMTLQTPHPRNPKKVGRLRPHIVWFGEMPLGMEQIEEAVMDCDCFVSIGTSGKVYPAAGLVHMTPKKCWRVEINLDTADNSNAFDDSFLGRATEQVPRFIEAWKQRFAENSDLP